ncbi:MAG: hemerythrin domain-containing protein [Pseudomonadota bacterium]|nr:hemerythrin domain-containing protein [Pseudomonadota bacterium]
MTVSDEIPLAATGPLPGAEELLQAMADFNRRLLDHCADLRRLVPAPDERGFHAHARADMHQLSRFFAEELPRHHDDQDLDLLPALIESMAGSDAVCLREITDLLTREHRELRRQWLIIRPAIDGVCNGRTQALPVPEIEAFVERCEACVAREGSELLPMAARLLSDAQLAAIGESMHRRRLAPT